MGEMLPRNLTEMAAKSCVDRRNHLTYLSHLTFQKSTSEPLTNGGDAVMADRVLIPLPGVGTLALTREEYEAGLAAGRELSGAPAPSLEPTAHPLFVDATEIARLTNTAVSWWESAARESDCPSLFIGKVRRFKVAECLHWLEQVQERDGAGRSRRCGAVPRGRT